MKKEHIISIWKDTKSSKLKDADFYQTSNSTLSKYVRVFETIKEVILNGGEEESIAREYLGDILNGERIIAIVIAMSPRFHVRDWPAVHEQLNKDNVDSSKIHSYMNSNFEGLFKEGFSPRVRSSVDNETGDLFDLPMDNPKTEELQLEIKSLREKNRALNTLNSEMWKDLYQVNEQILDIEERLRSVHSWTRRAQQALSSSASLAEEALDEQ
jgi:hypothetical protein